MQPKVSVIIPVYNIASYLSTCLESVVNQSYTNLEIVVINDGSTDESPKIVDRYTACDPRITCISQPNRGLPAARQTGTEAASGDFILHLDGDDYLPHEAVEVLVRKQGETGADMVFGNFTECYPDHSESITIDLGDLSGAEISGADYLRQVVLSPVCRRGYVWGRLLRKELLQNLSYQQTNLEEDVYMMFQIASRCRKIAFTEQVTYYYRRHRNSITNENAVRFQRAHILHCLAMCDLLPTLSLPRDIVECSLIYNLRSIAYYFCICKVDVRSQEWKNLKALYRKTKRLDPTIVRRHICSRHFPYFVYIIVALRVPVLTGLAYAVSGERRRNSMNV